MLGQLWVPVKSDIQCIHVWHISTKGDFASNEQFNRHEYGLKSVLLTFLEDSSSLPALIEVPLSLIK